MQTTYSEVRIQAHIECAPRLVVGRRACAIHVSAGNRVADRLGVTGPELAFVEHVIDTCRDADIFHWRDKYLCLPRQDPPSVFWH